MPPLGPSRLIVWTQSQGDNPPLPDFLSGELFGAPDAPIASTSRVDTSSAMSVPAETARHTNATARASDHIQLQPPSTVREALPDTGYPEIDNTQKFINALWANRRLQDSLLDEETLSRLQNPLRDPAILTPDQRLSLKLYLTGMKGTDDIYAKHRDAILERHPEDEIPSLYRLHKQIAELTGVQPLWHDMCPASCMAYTGPFENDVKCSFCKTAHDRYKPGTHTPLRQFATFPLGPQIQSRFRSLEGAYDMRHRERRMEEILEKLVKTAGKLDEIGDIYEGSNFWDAYCKGRIGKDDVCVIFSMDGAQLFEHKASNCWIYIWILVDVAPDQRYKKKYILPGAIVPGPDKPDCIESFLYPGFQHVAALQHEGMMVWDASDPTRPPFRVHIYLFLGEADHVGSTDMTGYVAHHGKNGCRHRCKRPGRRKPGASHYYSVCLKPDGYCEQGCDADDYEPSDVPESSAEDYYRDLQYLRNATSQSNYYSRRLQTGIVKPSIFSGLHPDRTSPIPSIFPGDIMHLFGLNITGLLVSLWRGTIDCDTKNGDDRSTWDWMCLRDADTWTKHGAAVAAAKHYLPGSFDRPPRDPAEKISSGYKCWEYLTWIYGLAPGLLYRVLPDPYWKNYCMLVAGARIMYQPKTVQAQRERAHQLISDFIYNYELSYMQRQTSRMHFAPQCLHSLSHTPTQTTCIGPLISTSQFPMERIIGDLGSEIKQPSLPFENLAQRALRRAQNNVLTAMFPDLDPVRPSQAPKHELGDGYTLLHPRQPGPRSVEDHEDVLIMRYIEEIVGTELARRVWVEEMECCVQKWARCRLPNGQICRSAWKEIANNMTRLARNVKVCQSL